VTRGEHCREGCPTQDHDSYGECLRAARIRVAYCDSVNRQDCTRQKKWDRELSDYRDCVRQGMNPDGTGRASIDKAVAWSEATGRAYDATKNI
jgi:hypothetical protein